MRIPRGKPWNQDENHGIKRKTMEPRGNPRGKQRGKLWYQGETQEENKEENHGIKWKTIEFKMKTM